MPSFRDWIEKFPGVTDVTTGSFLYTPEGNKHSSRILYEESAIQEWLASSLADAEDVWGKRPGVSQLDAAYLLLTVHLDNEIDFVHRQDDAGVFRITAQAIEPVVEGESAE